MIRTANGIGELREILVYLNINCGGGRYPTEFQTYDEAWAELQQSLDHLRAKLGDVRHVQLADMAAQAKGHFDAGYAYGDFDNPTNPGFHEINLGSWLMLDMQQIVKELR